MEHLKKIKPTHLSLFSGIGGLDLAAEWAGFETVGQCEMADFPTKILEKHWPYVQRWRDIRTLTKENFIERTGLQTVDIISGGFPCQPFSVAGKQKGREDDRYLWPDMRRVIAEFAPRWVVGENVPGILRIAAADVVQDLESLGYDVVLLDFEAASVGAPHHRERIAFVAHCNSVRKQSASGSQPEGGYGPCNGCSHVANTDCRELWHVGNHGRSTDRKEYEAANTGDDGRTETSMANAMRFRSKAGTADQETWQERNSAELIHSSSDVPNSEMWGEPREQLGRSETRRSCCSVRWPTEPDVGRVAYGVPNRVDRIKGLGNAVCPPQFYPIFAAIYEWETKEHYVKD